MENKPRINSYTSWQPLEEVIVGRAYSPDYFDFIDNPQVRNQLQQILAETEEDLANLARTIETYGARVRRPDLPSKDSFIWHQTEGGGAPLPPLTPRDWQITLGDRLLRVLAMPELDSICADYADQVINPHRSAWDTDCILNQASASCIVRVGEDVFFDNSDYLKPEQSQWIVDTCLDSRYRVHEAVTDGHGDAVFILSSKHDMHLHLAEDFPGWDVCKIWDSSIWAAMEVGRFKYEESPGAWYIQGQTPTAEFTQFVDTYLTKWTGFVAETVFDVNCLVLDEETVIFSAYNREVFDYCKRHRITPIISELRHSYFWDGGIWRTRALLINGSCCSPGL